MVDINYIRQHVLSKTLKDNFVYALVHLMVGERFLMRWFSSSIFQMPVQGCIQYKTIHVIKINCGILRTGKGTSAIVHISARLPFYIFHNVTEQQLAFPVDWIKIVEEGIGFISTCVVEINGRLIKRLAGMLRGYPSFVHPLFHLMVCQQIN